MADDITTKRSTPVNLKSGAGAKTGAPGAGSKKTGGGGAGDDKSVVDKFKIPETVRKQYPDLIPLILGTESMSDEERQYWFQILPIMTDEQVQKLRDILLKEKKQLQKLDQDYKQEVKKINEKHVAEWKAFEAKEKRKKLQETEGAAEHAEKGEEEELLKKLQNL